MPGPKSQLDEWPHLAERLELLMAQRIKRRKSGLSELTWAVIFRRMGDSGCTLSAREIRRQAERRFPGLYWEAGI